MTLDKKIGFVCLDGGEIVRVWKQLVAREKTKFEMKMQGKKKVKSAMEGGQNM